MFKINVFLTVTNLLNIVFELTAQISVIILFMDSIAHVRIRWLQSTIEIFHVVHCKHRNANFSLDVTFVYICVTVYKKFSIFPPQALEGSILRREFLYVVVHSKHATNRQFIFWSLK
jgi:hypothetical protein